MKNSILSLLANSGIKLNNLAECTTKQGKFSGALITAVVSSLLLVVCSPSAFAEGSGDFCKDRLAAMEYFKYEVGNNEAKLDMDDAYNILSAKERRTVQKNLIQAEKSFDLNKAEFHKKCIVTEAN